MGNHENEKYIVASSGEYPNQIFFDWKTAEASQILYLDAFDAEGTLVMRYMRVAGEYTTDF
jgi:hypothetical protein